MNISFDFPDADFNSIRTMLKSNLNLNNIVTDQQINDKLNDLAKAAFHEYINMITDVGMPTKTSDVLNSRILLLVEHYFKKFPADNDIALLFNITQSKSQTTLNNLKSTHRNKLRSKLETQLKEFLNTGVDLNNGTWEFNITSKPIIQELNNVMVLKDPGLEAFKQKPNTVGKVTLADDSLIFLRAEYGI